MIARGLAPLVALALGSYLLIIHPQVEQRRRTVMINRDLKPGVTVQTANNHCGVVIFVTNSTIIMELATGQKIEVLKQTITAITHEKP